jgi:hypothetical protein
MASSTTAATLTAVSTAVAAAGTLMAGAAQSEALKAGAKAEGELAEYKANQLKVEAGQRRASAQRAAIEERRKGRLAQSRATAVAAASGGGVVGTDVENILANLGAEGEYNAQAALYEGDQEARGMEDQANAELYGSKLNKSMASYQARVARNSSYVSAGGDLLKGAGTFYDKFWPDDATASTGSVSQSKSGNKFGKYSSQVAYQ